MELSQKIKDTTKKLTHLTIQRIGYMTDIEIPKEDLPKVTTVAGEGSVYRKGEGIQIDVLGNDSMSSIGEEASHFVREYIIKKRGLPTDKRATEEFFGYLGTKAIAEKDKRKPKEPLSRKEALRISKLQRTDERHYQKMINLYESMTSSLNETKEIMEQRLEQETNQSKRNQILDEILEITKTKMEKNSKKHEADMAKMKSRHKRETYLSHARGYNFAAEMDLGKTDLAEAYHLPDSEVRKRFFRKDKRYSATQDKPTVRRGLEKVVGILFVSISLFLLGSGVITGNVVGSSSIKNPLIILLIILGVITISLNIHRTHKTKN